MNKVYTEGEAHVWSLGPGYNDPEMEDRVNGEYSGPKYADLGIYKNGQRVLNLGIDHHEIRMDDWRGADVNALRNVFTELIGHANARAADKARIEALEGALRPIVDFIEAFDRKPVKLHDDFYGIHAGTEFEAVLRLSDLRKIALLTPRPEGVDSKEPTP